MEIDICDASGGWKSIASIRNQLTQFQQLYNQNSHLTSNNHNNSNNYKTDSNKLIIGSNGDVEKGRQNTRSSHFILKVNCGLVKRSQIKELNNRVCFQCV